MNIFKILTRGDGTIDEANVSAFLGYLLNPNEEHGLRDELLRKIIAELKNKMPKNDFLNKITPGEFNFYDPMNKYRVEVFLEQAFASKVASESGNDNFNNISTKTKKKQIADIIIVISEKAGPYTKKETLFLNPPTSPVAIILIENKIKANATVNQLELQYNYSHQVLKTEPGFKNISDNIYLIYLTPEGEEYDEEFENVSGKEMRYRLKTDLEYTKFKLKGIHLLWNVEFQTPDEAHVDDLNANLNKENSITTLLSEIIKNESCGEIEPLQEYNKHTIKAFLNFIRSEFTKSKNPVKLKILGLHKILENFQDNKPVQTIIPQIDKFLKDNKTIFKEYDDIQYNTMSGIASTKRISFKLKGSQAVFFQIDVQQNALVFILKKNKNNPNADYKDYGCKDHKGFRAKKRGIIIFGQDEKKMIQISYQNTIS